MSMKSSWGLIEIKGCGKINKKKCSEFISRGQRRLAEKRQRDTSQDKRREKFQEFVKNTEQIKIQKAKDGRYFYQPRKNGKFLARIYLSESLARKLDETLD